MDQKALVKTRRYFVETCRVPRQEHFKRELEALGASVGAVVLSFQAGWRLAQFEDRDTAIGEKD